MSRLDVTVEPNVAGAQRNDRGKLYPAVSANAARRASQTKNVRLVSIRINRFGPVALTAKRDPIVRAWTSLSPIRSVCSA